MGFIDTLISWMLDFKIVSKHDLMIRIDQADTDLDGYISIKELLAVFRKCKE